MGQVAVLWQVPSAVRDLGYKVSFEASKLCFWLSFLVSTVGLLGRNGRATCAHADLISLSLAFVRW